MADGEGLKGVFTVPLPRAGLAGGALPAARGKRLTRKALHPLEGRGCRRSPENCKDPLHPPREKE